MKNFSKRFISVLMAIVTCLCFTLSVSATEFENTLGSLKETSPRHITYEVTSEGIVSVEEDGVILPRSSISGYTNGTCTAYYFMFKFNVTSSGSGGMGVTVKTSSSWSGYMSMDIGSPTDGYYIQNYAMPSNGERQFHHGLTHNSPTEMIMYFYGIPSDVSVYVEVWVYG